MSFEVDPVFHTKTMIKILQSQGHLQYAARLCEKALEQDESNASMKALLQELKELRTPFLKIEKKTPVVVEEEVEFVAVPEVLSAATDLVADLSPLESSEVSNLQADENYKKIEKLQALLQKIQERK